MISFRTTVAFVAACLCFGQAKSDELPTPRRPVGTQLNEMFPQGRAEVVPSDRVRIRNVGNQVLSLQWWDEGVTAWRTISIGPGHSFDLICNKCGNAIDIAFNDGRATREVKTVTGDVYILRWSLELQAWELTDLVAAVGAQ
jgi:hypothetical protein